MARDHRGQPATAGLRLTRDSPVHVVLGCRLCGLRHEEHAMAPYLRWSAILIISIGVAVVLLLSMAISDTPVRRTRATPERQREQALLRQREAAALELGQLI